MPVFTASPELFSIPFPERTRIALHPRLLAFGSCPPYHLHREVPKFARSIAEITTPEQMGPCRK